MGDIQPGPTELLRAALEKIVFFEWRVSELQAELSAAQSRCASAEAERARADDEARAAEQRAKTARMHVAELEAERARLSALLSQPGRSTTDLRAVDAEREKSQRLQLELDEARREVQRSRQERERWLTEMTEQARGGDEAPAALAQFISELRGEVISLRALLTKAGIAVPEHGEQRTPPPPVEKGSAVDDARVMLAEGRLATPALTTHFAVPADPNMSAAARALADQCLRNLASADSARREQAAKHLAAVPLPSAAPSIAAALGSEKEPKARAQLAKALIACGGEGAAELVARLQNAEEEAPLVRLAALEALATTSHAAAAIERASQDPAPAVRRRAAALANPEAAEPAAAPAPEPIKTGPADQLLQAVQAALFGLTESELAEHIGVPEPEVSALAQKMVASGQLGRRGKRLVLAAGGAP